MVANAIHPPYGKLSCAAIACFNISRMDSMYPIWECAMFGDVMRICQQGAQYPASMQSIARVKDWQINAACVWGVRIGMSRYSPPLRRCVET